VSMTEIMTVTRITVLLITHDQNNATICAKFHKRSGPFELTSAEDHSVMSVIDNIRIDNN